MYGYWRESTDRLCQLLVLVLYEGAGLANKSFYYNNRTAHPLETYLHSFL